MKVYGASIVKGMLYTLKTFVGTYVEDFKRKGSQETEHGLRSQTEGVVTVQYPEQEMPIGSTYERFRVLPMLIYDQKEDEKDVRCTSCGICAKVCPPQCIWIVQESDEKGKPIPKPQEFYIDMSVCMNCSLCAEFCPFDAIKMDHQFALNVTENRQENYLYDLEKLLVPAEYYAELHPKANAEEEANRKADAEAKAKKEIEKKARLAKKAAEKAAAAESGDAGEAADKPKAAKAEDPERAARIAAAKEKAAAAKAKKEAEKAAAAGTLSEAEAEQAVPASTEPKPAKTEAGFDLTAAAESPVEAQAEANPVFPDGVEEISTANEAGLKKEAVSSAVAKPADAAPKAAPATEVSTADLLHRDSQPEISEAEAEQAVPPSDQIAPVPAASEGFPVDQELPDSAEAAQAQAEANPVFPDGVEEISSANEAGQSPSTQPAQAPPAEQNSDLLAEHQAEIAKAADTAKAEAQANPVLQNPADSNEAGQTDNEVETPKASPEA